jgi:hypothetical protein
MTRKKDRLHEVRAAIDKEECRDVNSAKLGASAAEWTGLENVNFYSKVTDKKEFLRYQNCLIEMIEKCPPCMTSFLTN